MPSWVAHTPVGHDKMKLLGRQPKRYFHLSVNATFGPMATCGSEGGVA